MREGVQMTEGGQPIFSPAQRQRLRSLGLIDAQIDELETNALPLSRAWLRKPPTLQDVRDELQALFDAMERAAAAMSRLLSADKFTPAMREAQARLLMACFEIHHDPHDNHDHVEKAFDALSRAKAVVQYAQESLPKTQRRHEAASVLPVKCIDKALLSGFIKGHKGCMTLPRYELRRSYSPKSKYRRIVGICYEAMGQQVNKGPERAIKAFIAWRRLTDEAGRIAVGIPDTATKRRGRPRRIGRQGGE